MLTRVADATGRSVFDLVDAPFHEVVYEFLLLDELEEKRALVREKESLDAAVRLSFAFHDGKKLARELREFNARLHQGARPRAAQALTPDVMARVNAILAANGKDAMRPAQPAEVS